jgi:phosphate transport system permease protein
MESKSFTGRSRERKTSWKVRWGDRIARGAITLGGIGTIVAVCTVCAFLAWVVLPLFLPSHVLPAGSVRTEASRPGAPPFALRVDEYGALGWTFGRDGTLDVFRADTGAALDRRRPFGEAALTAAAFAPTEGRAVFAFADGTARFADLGFRTSFPEPETLPAEIRSLRAGERAAHKGGVVERTVEGQYRLQDLRFQAEEPFDLESGGPAVRIDMTAHGSSPRLAACTADGRLRLVEITQRKNQLTGKVRTLLSGGSFRLPEDTGRGPPDHVLLSGVGTMLYAAWSDGHCLRIDARVLEAPTVAETLDLVPEPEASLTSLGFLIGRTTLAAGDSLGRLRTWFPVRPTGATTVDGAVLVLAHTFPGGGAAVTCSAPSERTRLVAAGYQDGSVRLYHVTSDRLLGEGRAEGGGPVEAISVAPKDDGVVATARGAVHRWTVDAPHPETTLHSLFRPVRYEGEEKEEHVWQSSSGTDDFEPKFGLMPLVFGTLKATLFSMLFAAPLAILAAIFTSEYLHPSTRARVKPTLELMASLPSVVLGFLAAIVIAQFVEKFVPALLTSFATIPFTLLLGAHLWQLLPRRRRAPLERWRLPLATAAIPAGALLAWLLGPFVEARLFAGDLMGWLDGQKGSATGGWFLFLLPVAALGTTLLRSRDGRADGAGRALLEFLLRTAAAVAVTLVVAEGLTALGLDPRGPALGTYVQRNAMVVGLVMGFAVIPIIYTLSEDALVAVPEHLRAASLALGATRWQTAVLVILPTAASGIFSACMVGLGRAVGETMIVLMAAGNTPVMRWNPFDGFRTLSANIAVELPEAVQNGTQYRVLFLAALVLFAMTFALNTAAEMVRQKFRKRAFEL